MKERNERFRAGEPSLRPTTSSGPRKEKRLRCQCGKFISRKKIDQEGGPAKVCRWCGKMADCFR